MAQDLGLNVRLADGDDASGLAVMVADLLADNVREFRGRAAVARVARGDLVLNASDRDVSVTLSFRPGEVVVSNGAAEGAPVLAGPWLDMAGVCSGRTSPVAALLRRRLRVTRGDRMSVVPAGGFTLSVPASFYGESNRRRRILVAGVALLLLAVCVRSCRRHCAR
ncbi:MAG: hypothetical protein HYU28_02800 [Actinobacteria bacterium]|nr:hypothetical protein [Actinomycetota bacterium]